MKQEKRFLALCVVVIMAMILVSPLWAGEMGKININKASVAELTKLKRIGPKTAQRVLEYRKKHGPFEMPEDIMKVKGIGPKTFELNKDRIIVE